MLCRDDIRENLKQQRACLSARECKTNSDNLTTHFRTWFESYNSYSTTTRQLHIAGYLAIRGEIDPSSILSYLREAGHMTYLPVMQPDKNSQLLFAPLTDSTSFKIGKYAIQEPVYNKGDLINGNHLDLVLLPLVAVDKKGNRIGMGGGYYDRTFSFKIEANTQSDQPKLLGLCHHFQLLESVPVEDWDVPLDSVITDETVVK